MNHRVIIGIQARSTSQRFPRKIHQYLGTKTLLEHIIESAQSAAKYINNFSTKRISVETALLIPKGDEAKDHVPADVKVIEGPEDDVLGRYMLLANLESPDFIVRITADCPLIPSFIISKLITLAVMNDYDYISNVDERARTAPDGHDCEVISLKLLHYADSHAHGKDREHVTTFIRRHPPTWIRWGAVVNYLDLSHLMISVNTPEDLERVRQEWERAERARIKAVSIFGKRSTHKV